MKKIKTLISLLLVFTVLAGVVIPGFADENIIEETPAIEETQKETAADPVETMVAAFEKLFVRGNDTDEAEEAEETEDDETPAEPAETQEPADGEGEVTSVPADAVTPAAPEEGEQGEDNGENNGNSGTVDKTKGSFSFWKSVFYDQSELSGRFPIIATSTIFKSIRYVIYFLTGHFLYGPPKNFEVSVSDDIVELCDYMKDNSSLDLYKILTNLPDTSDTAKVIGKVFHIDTKEYRAEMYEKRDEFNEQGDWLKANLCWLVGAYMSGIEKADVYTVPYEDVHQVELLVTYSDGTTEIFHPEIYINFETGECFGNDERGMIGSGFNTNVYDMFVYAPMYCWMRDFGFCVEYDLLCYMLPMYRYRTRRFKFSYDDRDWMIQCWTGSYMCTNGGEVGIYNREKGKFGSYYDVITDDELMPMSLQVLHGDDMIVNVEETPHWWVNGFKLTSTLYHPMSMTEIFTITFPDETMRDAFTQAVDKNMYHDVSYTVDGLKVTCTWG